MLLICAITWVLSKIAQKAKLGKWCLYIALAVIILLGYSPLSSKMISNLENKYETIEPDHLRGHSTYDILVLGGGHVNDPDVHAMAQLELSSLARLTEGVRLSRQVVVNRFVCSGYYPHGEQSHAQVMKNAAISLGVDRGIISTMDESLTTMDEAITFKQLEPTDQFILVTSASHMPRSMKTFQSLGMNPIAAPTDFKIREDPAEGFNMHTPGTKFRWFRLAMHEYIGMLYYRYK